MGFLQLLYNHFTPKSIVPNIKLQLVSSILDGLVFSLQLKQTVLLNFLGGDFYVTSRPDYQSISSDHFSERNMKHISMAGLHEKTDESTLPILRFCCLGSSSRAYKHNCLQFGRDDHLSGPRLYHDLRG